MAMEIIQFMDPTGKAIVHRWPEYGSTDITLGSQLIVQENQAAVFFRDGKALDTFLAGRHTLTTQNIPLLTQLVNKLFGGDAPFQAQVYFVGLQTFLDLKWGTKEPIIFRDKELAMVRLRAFGKYSVKVRDARLFVAELAGTRGVYTTESIENYFRDLIVARLNDLLGENLQTIIELPRYYDELAVGCKSRVFEDFTKYGIELVDFFITAITPPEEVQKMIDERSSMGAIGDMGRFMQYKTAKAVEKAAEQGGEGGGAAGAGMGLGVGVGMGMMMPGMIQKAMQGDPAAASAGAACPKCRQPVAPGTRFCSGCGQSLAGVKCPACNADNLPGAKFCSGCGVALAAPKCPGCGQENLPGARFCSGCGQKL